MPLLLLSFSFFFLFFSNLVFYSPFAPFSTKSGPSESALGQETINQRCPGRAATGKLHEPSQQEKEPAATSLLCVPGISELNGSLVFTLQSHKIQRGISERSE